MLAHEWHAGSSSVRSYVRLSHSPWRWYNYYAKTDPDPVPSVISCFLFTWHTHESQQTQQPARAAQKIAQIHGMEGGTGGVVRFEAVVPIKHGTWVCVSPRSLHVWLLTSSQIPSSRHDHYCVEVGASFKASLRCTPSFPLFVFFWVKAVVLASCHHLQQHLIATSSPFVFTLALFTSLMAGMSKLTSQACASIHQQVQKDHRIDWDLSSSSLQVLGSGSGTSLPFPKCISSPFFSRVRDDTRSATTVCSRDCASPLRHSCHPAALT